MNRSVKIGKAAELLGVSVQTLRRWEQSGVLLPEKRGRGVTRYYNIDKLLNQTKKESDLTIGYARVSSHDQKEDLAKDVLEIITVFSARLYGARSHKNKKLVEAAKVLIDGGVDA